MSIRSACVVALALFCGLCAAVGVTSMSPQTPVAAKVETETVLVAAVEIARGSVVSEEFLSTRDYPKDQIPSGALTDIADAVDRAVLIQMLPGEPVLDKKLAGRDQGRGISPLVRPGMRAFTILTPTPAAAVAGFIMPSNRVDVLLTVSPSGRDDASGGGSTTTLMQNIEIMAVNRNIDLPDGQISTESLVSVTLQVTPEQVAKLTLAQNRGVLNLSLRNESDHTPGEARPVTMVDLRYDQENPLRSVPSMAMQAINALAEWVPPPNAAETREIEIPKAPVADTHNLQIRTLRGNSSGGVWLQQTQASTAVASDKPLAMTSR